MAVQIVNDKGMTYLRDWLLTHHKHGHDLSRSEIRAWAAEAEDHLDEHGEAYIELRSFEAAFGRTKTFTIPDDGLEDI